MKSRSIIKFIKYALLSLGLLLLLVGVNFFAVRKLDKDILEAKVDFLPESNNRLATQIPSMFSHGARFYVKLPLVNGDTILGFGDTGGGITMLLPATAEKENLNGMIKTGILKGIMPFHYILFSDLVSDHNFPKPFPLPSFILRNPFKRVTEPYLAIPPLDDEINFMVKSMPDMEAFLGQSFFMGKAWTIDYLQQKIWVNTPLSESAAGDANVKKLGFKKNSHGDKLYGHGSMTIEIDGEKIDVLFDTGATIVLSEEGKKAFNTNELTMAASFIATSIFDKWRMDHPEWKYFPKADFSSDVIEVPIIKIGGIEVGPVLFSKRPDENWSENMINSMDKVVKGAIGGSALKYLKVTVDYNSELIKLER